MKRRSFLAHLQEHDCELVREGGKHSWWRNSETGVRSAVPRHSELMFSAARSARILASRRSFDELQGSTARDEAQSARAFTRQTFE